MLRQGYHNKSQFVSSISPKKFIQPTIHILTILFALLRPQYSHAQVIDELNSISTDTSEEKSPSPASTSTDNTTNFARPTGTYQYPIPSIAHANPMDNNTPTMGTKLTIILSILGTILVFLILSFTLLRPKHLNSENGSSNGNSYTNGNQNMEYCPDTSIMIMDPREGYVARNIRVIRAGEEGWWIPNENGVGELFDRYFEPLPCYTNDRLTTTQSNSPPTPSAIMTAMVPVSMNLTNSRRSSFSSIVSCPPPAYMP